MKEGNKTQIWKKRVESVALCFTFPCTVAQYMSIIRLRLPSVLSCSLSHWTPHLRYYQLYCHQPYHSCLFFPSTRRADQQKVPVFSAVCWLIVMAQSLYPNNAVKRLYPERVLACVVHLTRSEKKRVHVKCPCSHINML